MRSFPASPRRWPGLTLIEVIVAVSVLGILALLTLAAVQHAREGARRATCISNLRQLGVAIQSYCSVAQCFPPGNNGRVFSAHAVLLPHLDQTPLYNAVNFQTTPLVGRWMGRENLTVRGTSLALFLCPSDSHAGRGGINNYAGNRGSGVQKYGYNGAFGLSGAVGLESFADGMSNTSAMAEWVTGVNSRPRAQPNRLVFETAFPLLKPDEFDLFARLCSEADVENGKLSPLVKGETWLVGEFSYTLYNHVVPINGYSCTNNTGVQEGAWTAGSNHGSGANVLFADGHARYVMQTISLQTWRAMGSRNGGDVVSGANP
ncbi:MAG: DUF1559 domain-containing protein [Isosphaeraceae bacterium]